MRNETKYVHKRSLASGIPLGGLGTGSVEIRDDGRFHDWEIFNNNLWSGNAAHRPPVMRSEDAFFALRWKPRGEGAKARLLYDDDKKSEAVSLHHNYNRIYNFPWMWNIEEIHYSGQHPFADLTYHDRAVPLDVSLRAFTPFIPHNAKDSGLPLAYFVFRVKNRSRKRCETSLMFNMRNCVGYDLCEHNFVHRLHRSKNATTVLMADENVDQKRRTWGELAVTAFDPKASYLLGWSDDRGLEGFEGAHTPGCGQLYQSFRDTGRLPSTEKEWKRHEKTVGEKESLNCQNVLSDSRAGLHHWRSGVCIDADLKPGEEREFVFMLSWFFPNHYFRHLDTHRLGHMYENWFDGAMDVEKYGRKHFSRLFDESRFFAEQLYDGLEPWLAASLNAQLTTFPQAFWWTKNGELTAWEGMACCQVLHAAATSWSSFQPLMFFPELYNDMRKKMARYETESIGKGPKDGASIIECEILRKRQGAFDQTKRKDLGGWFGGRYEKLGYSRESFVRPAQVGEKIRFIGQNSAMMLLRDYQWSGDKDLIEVLWPHVSEALDAGIKRDKNGDGLHEGEISFITYDHWFLPGLNVYSATMWLAELSAGAELARIVGDIKAAERYTSVFEKGAKSFEKILWNGEYYDLAHDFIQGKNDAGCLADQVSGHLYERLCGIDLSHKTARVKKALKAVLKYNRREEEGLLNGSDPKGRDDWRYFARYSAKGSDEQYGGQWPTPWTGTEYYVAAVMIAEGLVREGLQVARDVWDRHIAYGQIYNHIECGEHYFRPMVAWAMLPALQGLVYDAASGRMHFSPKYKKTNFDTVFILPNVWGRLSQKRTGKQQRNAVKVLEGELTIGELRLSKPRGEIKSLTLKAAGRKRACDFETRGSEVIIKFKSPAKIGAGKSMEITMRF